MSQWPKAKLDVSKHVHSLTPSYLEQNFFEVEELGAMLPAELVKKEGISWVLSSTELGNDDINCIKEG